MDIRAWAFEDRIQTKTDGHCDELIGLFERWTRGGYSKVKGKRGNQ